MQGRVPFPKGGRQLDAGGITAGCLGCRPQNAGADLLRDEENSERRPAISSLLLAFSAVSRGWVAVHGLSARFRPTPKACPSLEHARRRDRRSGRLRHYAQDDSSRPGRGGGVSGSAVSFLTHGRIRVSGLRLRSSACRASPPFVVRYLRGTGPRTWSRSPLAPPLLMDGCAAGLAPSIAFLESPSGRREDEVTP